MVVHWPAMGAGAAELALATVVAVGCGVLGCKRRRSANEDIRDGHRQCCLGTQYTLCDTVAGTIIHSAVVINAFLTLLNILHDRTSRAAVMSTRAFGVQSGPVGRGAAAALPLSHHGRLDTGVLA